jgi:hypothetical protein
VLNQEQFQINPLEYFSNYLSHQAYEFVHEALSGLCILVILVQKADIDHSTVLKVINLIDSPINEIHEKVVELIGSLSLISADYRNQVVALGGLEKLLEYIPLERIDNCKIYMNAFALICYPLPTKSLALS